MAGIVRDGGCLCGAVERRTATGRNLPLSGYFGNMGAVVLGPASTVEHASMHTEAAEAAILDVNLNGRRVFPIADELMRRGVPFVFFSGDEDIVIPERLRHASKPSKIV